MQATNTMYVVCCLTHHPEASLQSPHSLNEPTKDHYRWKRT